MGRCVRTKFVLAGAALLALAAGPACAADLPIYKAPPIAAPFSPWSGFYAGVNLGGAWGRFPLETINGSPTPVDAAAGSAAETLTVRSSSFTGGVQAGYNWQSGQIVFGLEADISWLPQRASQGPAAFPFGSNPALTFVVTQSVRTNWLATARPRVGFTANNVLVYATGGLAVADLRYDESINDAGCCAWIENASLSKIKAGWVGGGGLEVALQRNWSAKAEYLHAEFSGETTTAANTVGEVNIHRIARYGIDIARAGINYRFAPGN